MKGSPPAMGFEGRDELDEYLKTEPYITENLWKKFEAEKTNVVILNG